MKSMIIKDIALLPLENSEIYCQEVNVMMFYSNTRLKIISYQCGMNSNFENASGSYSKRMKIFRSNHEF